MSTTAEAVSRPLPGEYAPHYEKYIAGVQGDDILAVLEEQRRQMMLLLTGCCEADGDIRYAPEKWSVKEVIGHICDAERIFAYRALRIARHDTTALAGFDENDYVKNAPFARMPLQNLIEEFIAVRRGSLSLFRNLEPGDWTRRGEANHQAVTVRALAFIIAGHELHHRNILKERYFKK